ncbi:MFS transporter, DHA2 family, multidrug resistance protein [Chitinophaga sp. YR627]|uniref:MFS transporter n=1 Tax=Chitinophaga sp. YR627 TaxID=1881041 RepID=UPI0008F2AE9D|nr:MFS transporter [Chitinophaga sp. YR627]SFO54461.1 MFS transporter, DHA2 family, multidrug resistance protein [Chitinophaga sp. YR627]
MKQAYFKPWVQGWDWGIRIALLLLLLSSLMQLGLFALTGSYIVAYLGVQQEDISFCLMSTYAGIIASIPMQFRFIRRFEMRNYLAANVALAILLNWLCIDCRDINILLVIRFLQGILTGGICVSTLILIFSRVPTHRAQLIGAAVFYPTILGNIVVAASIAAVFIDISEWKASYYCLIGIQLFSLLITMLLLRRSSGHRRLPLYQIDWVGFLLFALSALALAYTFIYGSRYYWFDDRRICYSSCIAGAGVILFLYRQSLLKRPLIHPGVFKSVHFVTGLCLLGLYYGGKDSINLVYNYAFVTLKWTPFQVAALGCCNIAGVVSLAVFSTRLIIAKKHNFQFFLTAGFGLMALFNLWMWYIMTPDLSFTDLLFPIFIQGAASGLLFVPIIIYILTSAAGFSGTSGIVLAACTRFTATLQSIAGLYNLQLYHNQYFKEGFLSYLTPDNPNTTNRLNTYQSLYTSKGFSAEQGSYIAKTVIWQSLGQQSQLLTNRAVFMTFALLMLSIALLVLIIPAIRKTCKYLNSTSAMESDR